MSEHDKFADDLPLLALGALEGPERDAVAAHARSCDQCSRELQRLNADLAVLALTTPIEQPPDRAKSRLMNAILKEPKTIALKSQPRQSRWWMLIPSAVALGLLFIVFALMSNNRSLQREIEAVKRDAALGRIEAQRAAQVLQVLRARDAAQVTLVSANAKPQPQGKAIYSPKQGLVFFASNFNPVPTDKAYELWLIPKQGAPIPAGVFKPDANGSATVLLPNLPKDVQAKAFAITIERAEGASTPTMPIVLLGQSS